MSKVVELGMMSPETANDQSEIQGSTRAASNTRVLATPLGLLLIVSLVGCDSSERYVITDAAPFYQTEVGLDKTRIDSVIEAVRAFSQRHQMDFLLARQSLGPGEFNASADGPSLNLKAMHSELLDKGVSISAIARGNPTSQDKALVEEFVAQVRKSSGDAPSAPRSKDASN